MEEQQPISYDLEPIRVGVAYRKKKYELWEADGEAAAKYRSAAARCARFGPDGKLEKVADGIGDVETVLVSQCLYELDEKGRLNVDVNGDPCKQFLVPTLTLRRWPATFIRQLFDKIKDISPGLEEKETPDDLRKQINKLQKRLTELEGEDESLKNSPGAMTAGSV